MHLHLFAVHFKLNLKESKNVPKTYMPIVAIGSLITSKHRIWKYRINNLWLISFIVNIIGVRWHIQ